MKTELHRIRLRTRSLIWRAVLALPVVVLLALVVLVASLRVVPDAPAISEALLACRGHRAAQRPSCDAFMPEWLNQLPDADAYVEWKTLWAYRVFQERILADLPPDAINESILAAYTPWKSAARQRLGRAELIALGEVRDWSEPVPDPPPELVAVLGISARMSEVGQIYRRAVADQRATVVADLLEAPLAQRADRSQTLATNSRLAVLILLGLALLVPCALAALWARPRDLTLTPHELRVGWQRIPIADIAGVELNRHGAIVHRRRGSHISFDVPDHEALLDFVLQLEEIVGHRPDPPGADRERPAVDPALSALRAAPQRRA